MRFDISAAGYQDPNPLEQVNLQTDSGIHIPISVCAKIDDDIQMSDTGAEIFGDESCIGNYTYTESEDLELDTQALVQMSLKAFSAKPELVRTLRRHFGKPALDSLAGEIYRQTAISFDIESAVNNDRDYSIFLSMVASGLIVGKNFEKEIPATVKVALLSQEDLNSIHCRTVGRDKTMWKSHPAVTEFSMEAIDQLSGMFDTLTASTKSKSLWQLMLSQIQVKAAYIMPSEIEVPLTAMTNLELATQVSLGTYSMEQILKAVGKTKASQIGLIAKAMSDSSK